MNIIFGICKPIENSASEEEMMHLAVATAAYAPDGAFTAVKGNIGMGFQPFVTTRFSRSEQQPISGAQDSMLVFDGRLDNRADLLAALETPDIDISDSYLVLAAFEKWGESAFAKLVGDWALALWARATRTCYLARDHAGTRSLYYQLTRDTLMWSTYLETFFAHGREHDLDDAYVARYLSGAPVGTLTPYRGIRAVPPAYFLAIRGNHVRACAHWSPLSDGEIRYGTDQEYESHFLTLFRQAVERRSPVGDPVIAQLSGGMDSTSIVCMSDHVRRKRGCGVADLLDTVSYLSSSEPNWNEAPFVAVTEAHRGKVGIHLDVPSSDALFGPLDTSARYLLPGVSNASICFQQRLREVMGRGHRAILSGIGGDEVLGGVPTPAPELANYLVQLNPTKLIRQGLAWSIANRNPLLHLLWGTVRYTAGLYCSGEHRNSPARTWIAPRLRSLCGQINDPGPTFKDRMRARPSALSNARAWAFIMDTLPHLYPVPCARYEYRYPFLDRNLVEFLFRVPREQIARPGRRRSLMRAALRDIVPVQVIERKRKAYVTRGPLVAIQGAYEGLTDLLTHSVMVEYAYVKPDAIRKTLDLVVNGHGQSQWPLLMKAILFELWLRTRSFRQATPVLPTQVSFGPPEPTPSVDGSIFQSR